MIVFDHVSKIYTTGNRENVGIEDVSVHIRPGEFVFLVGPSGAGKSTFIKLILRELEADEGEIFVDGKNVTEMSNREIPALRRSIGIVFQDFRLLPKKTVFENVAFAMEITHSGRRAIRRNVPQVLDLVGIADKADNYPDQLSAGEKQRVAIARAVINNPKMLIADEPTGNLDPVTAKDIMVLLNQINRRGTTVLMVTHAKDIVDRMNKRVIAIEGGKIVRDAEAARYGFHDAADPVDRYPDETTGISVEEIRASEETFRPEGLSNDTMPIAHFEPEEAVAAPAAAFVPSPPENRDGLPSETSVAPEEGFVREETAAFAAVGSLPEEPVAAERSAAPEEPAAVAEAETEPSAGLEPSRAVSADEDVPFSEEDLLEAIRESERRRAERYEALAEKRVGLRTFFGMHEDEDSGKEDE